MHVLVVSGMVEIARVEPPPALNPESPQMRRHPIRLVLAALAISALAACADAPTGPKVPNGARFDGTTGTPVDSLTNKPTSHQGTSI